MKKVLKLLPIAALLAACSSMEIDNEFQAYGNYLPSDFDAKIFVEVNPDIGAAQAMAKVTELSNAFTGNDAAKVADAKKFIEEDGKVIAEDYLKWSVSKIQEVYNVMLTSLDAGRLPALADASGLRPTDAGYWLKYNIYGQTDEIDFFSNFMENELDKELVIETYTKYSKTEGRPYRFCKPEEAGNKNRSEISSTEYAKYFFCDDNGSVLAVTN